MPVAGITHDIVMEDFDARHRRGYMLMRDRRGNRVFSIREAEPIARRQLTMGEITQAEDPSYNLTWFQDTWIKGIGGLNWRTTEDRGKLQISKKIETYPRGTIRPARELRSTTLSATPGTFAPTGFAVAPRDTSSGLTGGYEETELWAFVGGYTYSGGDDNWTRETRPQNDINYRNGVNFGKWVVAPGWWGGTDMDDIAMPYIYKEPTVAAWVASNRVQGRFKHFAVAKSNANTDVLWGGNNVTDTGKTIDGAHNGTTTTITANADISGDVSVNDIIVCGVGADAEQEAMLVTAVSTAAMTVVRAYGDGAVIYEGGEKIHVYYPHGIRSSSDPTNSGSWSSVTTIGEKEYPITGLAVEEDSSTLLIAKTDGLWQQYYEALEEGGRLFLRNLTIQFRNQGHPTNFTGVYSWNGHTLLPLGRGGLLDMDVKTGQVRDISFSVTMPELTSLHGQVLAITSGLNCIYLALKDNSSQLIHLVAGHVITVDGATDWAWEMLGEVGAGGAITDIHTTLWYDGTRDDHSRVWLGFTEDSVDEVPRFLPVGNTGDDKTDGVTNDTDCEAVFVRYDANLPRVNKHFSTIEVESKNLGAGGRQWTFGYRIDDPDGSFTVIDAVNKTDSFQTITLPGGLNGKLLELNAVPAMTDIGTTAPEIVSVRLTSQLHPDPTKTFPISLYLANNQHLLSGAEVSRVKGDLAQLHTWNESAADLTLETPDGNTQQVIFLPGTMRVDELTKEHGRNAEYRVTFMLASV
jgi:hypothetical protein